MNSITLPFELVNHILTYTVSNEPWLERYDENGICTHTYNSENIYLNAHLNDVIEQKRANPPILNQTIFVNGLPLVVSRYILRNDVIARDEYLVIEPGQIFTGMGFTYGCPEYGQSSYARFRDIDKLTLIIGTWYVNGNCTYELTDDLTLQSDTLSLVCYSVDFAYNLWKEHWDIDVETIEMPNFNDLFVNPQHLTNRNTITNTNIDDGEEEGEEEEIDLDDLIERDVIQYRVTQDNQSDYYQEDYLLI